MPRRHPFVATRLGRGALPSLSVCAAALVLGCSRDARTRLMDFFFERSPPSTAAAEDGEPRPLAPMDDLPVPGDPGVPYASIHPPFSRRECRNCHVRGLGQSPRADFLAACRECHPPLFAYHRFGHAPFVSRDCRFCHFMHVSRDKALLKAPQAVLCISCHPAQQDPAALGSYHKDVEALACTACHDPHFSDNQQLLKPEQVRRKARPASTAERASLPEPE